MSENKTKPTEASVEAFLASVEEKRRADCRTLVDLMQEVTGEEPVMWGSIVGFGRYRYRYASGREGEWFLTGFANRKQALTLYIMGGFDDEDDLMGKLGKYKTGKACLYVKKLEDVDMDVLRALVKRSAEHVAATSVDD
jgi:hypothetical protein